jgi:hypothetical protein
MPLKTLFILLIRFITNLHVVTTINYNYLLHCYTFTQFTGTALKSFHSVCSSPHVFITLYIFSYSHFEICPLTANCDIFSVRLSPRTDSENSLLQIELLEITVSLIKPSIIQTCKRAHLHCCMEGVFTDPLHSNEPGEGCVLRHSRKRKGHVIFPYCCDMMSPCLFTLLALRSGLHPLLCNPTVG